jgi:hypothetical protein
LHGCNPVVWFQTKRSSDAPTYLNGIQKPNPTSRMKNI